MRCDAMRHDVCVGHGTWNGVEFTVVDGAGQISDKEMNASRLNHEPVEYKILQEVANSLVA